MIQAEELYQILHRKPFQPFRLHLRDGRAFELRFEHLGMVGKTFVKIGVPESNPTDPTYPFAEHIATVNISDIIRVEPLTPASTST